MSTPQVCPLRCDKLGNTPLAVLAVNTRMQHMSTDMHHNSCSAIDTYTIKQRMGYVWA
jgi:hypothetical protein